MNNENIILTKEIENAINFKLNIYLFLKRFSDIIFSILGILFLIPLIIVVKLVYLISRDFNPIFFVQERIGKNGKPFKMIKFRTMVPNADKILKQLLKEDKKIAEEYNKYKKLEKDPRITKIGNLLRKFSLDEFPQFINILVGDMSLVGPRPYLFREKKDMGRSFNEIIKVKPGLTGHWQVNGRSDTDFKERLVMDKEYVNMRGIRIDIKIFFKTFLAVLKRDGAK